MRKDEQRVWDSMKRNAPKDVIMERVENIVAEGMPDVFVAAMGGQQTWVELKAAKVPKRESSKLLGAHGLRQSQKNWHKNACLFGIRSRILIRDDQGELYLLPGRHGDEANDMTRTELRNARIAATWQEIFEDLRT